MKKLLCICLIAAMLAGSLSAFAAGGFRDVPTGIWYESYVTELSQKGIIGGYPDGTFRPDTSVTYGQALKLILLAAGYPEMPAANGHWAGGYLNLAMEYGFLPFEGGLDLERPITRLEVAQLAARALGLSGMMEESPFVDSDDSEVLAMYQAGILQGSVRDGLVYFDGDDALLRSQISAIIWRIEQYLHGGFLVPEPPVTEIPPQEQPSVPVEPQKTITFRNDVIKVLEDVPVFAYDPASFYLENGRMQCTDPSVRLVHGIDVSAHQEDIDWEKVRADGIEFAVLRAAFRGYTQGNLKVDSYFEENIRQASQAGLDVGVYVFSQAITVQEAIEEADLLIELLAPHAITGPVVFDWEIVNEKGARTKDLDTDTLCEAANAFCSRVSEAGYTPMIYFNSDCGYLKYDLSRVMGYEFWFAQYRTQPDFYYNFHMWQYSDSGKVDGVKGKVDLDVRILPGF